MPRAAAASSSAASFFNSSSGQVHERHRLTPADSRWRRLRCSADVLPPEEPDPDRLSDEDREDDEAEQDRVRRCLAQQCAVEERMHDDQREQCVVQSLQPLPVLGFERPQGGVAGESEQPCHDHQRGKPGPVPQAETVAQRAAMGDEEVEEVADLSSAMHPERGDNVDAAEDGRPRPYVTAQVARDGIPPAEEEVGRPDEEREPEQREGNVAGGDGKPSLERALSDLLSTWADTRGFALALLLGRLVSTLLLRRLVSALLHRSGPTSAVLAGLARWEFAGKRAAENVRLRIFAGVEARKSHEQDDDHGAREGDWQMVANEAAKNASREVAGGARLSRGSHGWLHRHVKRPWPIQTPGVGRMRSPSSAPSYGGGRPDRVVR